MTKTKLVISGKTYDVRGLLREYGATWDGDQWIIDVEKWASLLATHGGDPNSGNKRDRARKAILAALTVEKASG